MYMIQVLKLCIIYYADKVRKNVIGAYGTGDLNQ